MSVNVDAWPVPPAGLFVVEGRAVYLRSTSPMTVAHETAPALELFVGRGRLSHQQGRPHPQRLQQCTRLRDPYGSSGLDEYFAECVRAYIEANDARSPWPAATREQLQRADPAMFEIVGGIFARLAGGEQMTFALEAT